MWPPTDVTYGQHIDTPHGLRQGILGERMWQPTTLAPEGPARPCKALTASPGECDLMRNPTHAQRTTSKIR
jgi:hypothetical protein